MSSTLHSAETSWVHVRPAGYRQGYFSGYSCATKVQQITRGVQKYLRLPEKLAKVIFCSLRYLEDFWWLAIDSPFFFPILFLLTLQGTHTLPCLLTY